ncbi:Rz-like lysis system protein LysB [Rahnella sp. PAMC 25559]|uniref:Rz-like lysis system protein LysB n=1 Tax=Rahnella sp. PAMC 25559 TaxID=3423225 RepID=UPI003D670854
MKFIIAALLLSLVASLAGWRWANNKVTEANRNIAQMQRALAANAATISELHASGQRNERAQVVLRQQITAAGQLANRRNQTITRLLNENETLRRWYQSALPDDVTRLHTRPEFTNPDDYLRWLSEGQQLPYTGQSSENQR